MKTVDIYFAGKLKDFNGGSMIYRYPESVISHLGYADNKKGKVKAKLPTMCELIYESEETSFDITLNSYDASSKVVVYINDFQTCILSLKKRKKETFTINVHERFKEHFNDISKNNKYVYKLVFSSQSRIIIYDVKCILKDYEKQYLLYGSSISQGAGASDILSSYAYILKQNLHINIVNKSLSGSCLLEKETVDYLSMLNVQGYILEIGCNVRGVMDNEEFKKRFSYLIDKLKEKSKPIVVISILDMFEHLYKDFKDIPYHQKNKCFIKTIKDKIKETNCEDIYLISSSALVKEIRGISNDLLHPSNYGHLMIGNNLSRKLKNILRRYNNGKNK